MLADVARRKINLQVPPTIWLWVPRVACDLKPIPWEYPPSLSNRPNENRSGEWPAHDYECAEDLF